MPADETEVHVKLVYDDNAAQVSDRVKKGLGDADHQAQGLNASLSAAGSKLSAGFMVAAGAVLAIGAAAYETEQAVQALVGAGLAAADAMELQERTMAGILGLADAGKHSFEELHRYAAGVREDMESAAIQSGTSTKEMAQGFDELFRRGNMSSEAVKDLTKDLALVGKVAPGGMQEVTQGLAMFEAGMIRGRNPIVQLISATGTLKGNAKEVATQLEKMTPEKQMEAAQKAIAKQAELMKAQGFANTPTLGELKTSFQDIRESVMESFGQPMVDALVPKLVSVRDYLAEHIETIKAYAGDVGDFVGQYIDSFMNVMGRVYEDTKRDWSAIYDSAKRIWNTMGEAFGLADETTDDIVNKLTGAIDTVTQGFQFVSETLRSTVDVISDPINALKAIVDDTVDVNQRSQKESERSYKEAGEAASRFGEGGGGGNEAAQKAFDDAMETYRKWEEAAIKAGELTQSDMDKDIATLTDYREEMASRNEAMRNEIASGGEGAVADFQAYVNMAIHSHNEGVMASAASMLAGSDVLMHAMQSGSLNIEGGFDHFIRMIASKAPEAAEALKKAGDIIKGEGGVKPTGGGGISIGGGNTINIKQDFRDQDPDRVIFQMRRDLVSLAENRRQAKTQTPFGV